MGVKAVLFDLDDTLLDYSGGVDASWQAACLACDLRDGLHPAALVGAIAESRRWFWSDPQRHRRERVDMLRAWQRIVEHALAGLGVSPDGLAPAIARAYASHRREVMRLFPDAVASLEQLRERGVALGMVTNGDASQQRDKIARHDLGRFFDVVVIEGEFGAGKPDEVVYRHALDALGVEPRQACMVGDHLENDVAGPQRLGVHGIWLDRRGQGLPLDTPIRPDLVLSTLGDLRV